MTAAMVQVGSLLALIGWAFVLLRPARPWSMREQLETTLPTASMADVGVLIPARNEAATLRRVLDAALAQGPDIDIVVVDDESSDATAEIARSFADRVTLISGGATPPGWTGKLWAQAQGLERLTRRWTLLLDADIQLAPGLVAGMRQHLEARDLAFVSLLATPPMQSIVERLLLPAYVFFFKLLYPFALANSPRSRIAAAAGGVILIRTALLRDLDAFSRIRGELIDDCALARLLKGQGAVGWTGVSRKVSSLRDSAGMAGIWSMVSRHAFTQLHYSIALLLLTTLIMIVMFVVPAIGTFGWPGGHDVAAAVAWTLMAASYVPTLRYYRRSALWSVLLPVIGLLYLLMTWTSAARYWRGSRALWRGRSY